MLLVGQIDKDIQSRENNLQSCKNHFKIQTLSSYSFVGFFTLFGFFHISIDPASSNWHVLICAVQIQRFKSQRLRIQMAVTILETSMYWLLVEKQMAALIQPSCLWILEEFRGNICGTAPHSHRWKKNEYGKQISCISSRINDSWRNSQQMRTRFCLLCIITWNKRLKIRT